MLLNKADSASAVLIKIDAGDVLAMASYPSFNPNNVTCVAPMQMRNAAINDSYEPGSTVKPLVILEGLVRPDSMLETVPYRVNGHLIRDIGPWPRLNMTGVPQNLSDIAV